MVDKKLGWLDNWLHCRVDSWLHSMGEMRISLYTHLNLPFVSTSNNPTEVYLNSKQLLHLNKIVSFPSTDTYLPP